MHRSLVSVLAGLLSMHAALSSAQARPPRRVSLQYTRAEGAQACIDPVSLARKVEAFTGPVLVAPSSAETALEAHIETRASGGFRARIQIGREGENAHGERVLETDSPDCRSFDDALSFVIATTIDPDLVLERVGALFDPTATPPKEALLEELANAPGSTMEPAAPPAAVRSEPKLPATVVKQTTRGARALGVGLHVNDELALPALGPAVLLRWRLTRWLAVGAGAHASFDMTSTSSDGGNVRRQEVAGSLLVCPGLPWGSRVELAVCLGPEFFLLHLAASGFADNRRGSLLDTGLLARPELSIGLTGPYSLRVAPSVRLGGAKTLTIIIQGQEGAFSQTSNIVLAGELSVARAF
jgi:hypothetical protein